MTSPACWGCAPALLLREVIPSQAGSQILLELPSILLWLAFLELDWLVGGERKESRDGMLMGQWLMKGLSISERFDVPGVSQWVWPANHKNRRRFCFLFKPVESIRKEVLVHAMLLSVGYVDPGGSAWRLSLSPARTGAQMQHSR